ncbi:MAG: UDP-N-acetylmuramoyl-L-alanyl-D-glutamate--2,6-diaminopimelate ligase [Pseudomonadota bacterium]
MTRHSVGIPQLTLAELLSGWVTVPVEIAGLEVCGLSLDSRDLVPGGVFLACPGASHHGLDFLQAAMEARAAAVLAEPGGNWSEGRIASLAPQAPLPLIIVKGLGAIAGHLASRFYGDPSRALKVIGVTGTNGKTSCTHFLAQALQGDPGCALIGTLGNGFPGRLEAATHTTPDAVRVQAILARFRGEGADSVAMEVSSHALHQGRIAGVAVDVAVFTNLTRDHLDYHHSMEAYAEAKSRLFGVDGLQAAVINSDDEFGRSLVADIAPGVRRITYGRRPPPQDAAVDHLGLTTVAARTSGLSLRVQTFGGAVEFEVPVVGEFNAYNILAVLGVLLAMDLPLAEAVERLAGVRGAPGRMELFHGSGGGTAVVDYAHTPDALEQALTSLHQWCAGRLICVFGCGGDRDRGKRPAMGAVAERLADEVILTDDNPRSEDGDAIVADILSGIAQPDDVRVERDRSRAIRQALAAASSGDCVLIAGKGHENYQLVGTERRSFSDREQVAQYIRVAQP